MELTKKEYWHSYWDKHPDIQEIDLDIYPHMRFDKLYSKYFSVSKSASLIEVGCAYSPWLIYFYKKFNCSIFGLDYSQKDCTGTTDALTKRNIDAKILCRDIFSDLSEFHNSFDIVFSSGVIEHFDNPKGVLEKIKNLCKDKGLMISVIPNMQGVTGFLQRVADKELYLKHNPLSPEDLIIAHNGIDKLFCGYFGGFNLGVVNSDKITGFRGKVFRKVMDIFTRISWWIFITLNFHPESKLFSPYVVFIGKKRGGYL